MVYIIKISALRVAWLFNNLHNYIFALLVPLEMLRSSDTNINCSKFFEPQGVQAILKLQHLQYGIIGLASRVDSFYKKLKTFPLNVAFPFWFLGQAPRWRLIALPLHIEIDFASDFCASELVGLQVIVTEVLPWLVVTSTGSHRCLVPTLAAVWKANYPTQWKFKQNFSIIYRPYKKQYSNLYHLYIFSVIKYTSNCFSAFIYNLVLAQNILRCVS